MKLATLQNHAKSLDTAQLREITVQGRATADDDNFAVYNLQTSKVASFVKPGYQIVQHKEVIEAVTDVLSNLGIPCEATLHNNGNKVFADIEFTKTKINAMKGEEFIIGIRVVNSYDKSTGIAIVPRLVRLVCTNGMVVTKALVKGYTIKHTKKLKEDFKVVVNDLIKQMVNSDKKLAEMISICMEDSVEVEIMDNILQKLASSKKKMEEVKEILHRDYGEKPRYNRWEIYNSMTNYISHGEQLAPSMQDYLERMSEKVLMTPLARLPRIEVVQDE